MDDELLAAAIAHQYRALFQMLRSAIEHCPDALWAKPLDEAPFWQQAAHAILSTQMYLRDSPQDPSHQADRQQLMADLGIGENETAEARLATLRQVLQNLTEPQSNAPRVLDKPAMLKYLDQTEQVCAHRVTQPSTLSSRNAYEWTGPTVAERLIYNLRHTQHHIGRMHSILGRHGIRMKWICTSADR